METMIFLVHHADAVGPDVDAQRPLSAAGRAHAQRLAAEAATRGVKPDAVWHSGKLRARQTADVFRRACNPRAEFAVIRGLRPDDPPGEIKARLAGERRPVMLVGHMPGLPRLLHDLLGLGEDTPARSFPQHGLIALEAADGVWLERWRLA
jgi:phosphohistidine phosphatase